MKRLIASSFLVATLFTGCQLNSDNDRFDTNAKEILDNKTWYYVDSISQTYKKSVFGDGVITVYKYNDKQMHSLKETKQISMDYADDNEFVVQCDNATYDGCSVETYNNGEYMTSTCYDDDKLPLSGWSTKEEAIADDARTR